MKKKFKVQSKQDIIADTYLEEGIIDISDKLITRIDPTINFNFNVMERHREAYLSKRYNILIPCVIMVFSKGRVAFSDVIMS